MDLNLKNASAEYDSSFESSSESKKRKKSSLQQSLFSASVGSSKRTKLNEEAITKERNRIRTHWQSMNVYEKHKHLINQYLLYHPGATKLFGRDTSRDKTDHDILRENHKFIWNDEDSVNTWGKDLAKNYYDKLFKEYCICDMTHYKEAKVGMRWRIKQEVIDGKGQFSCGNKHCEETKSLRTWEINFAYIEDDVKKNCLVKLRLCHDCSWKLNYRSKFKEVSRKKHKRKKEHKKKLKEKSQKNDSDNSSDNVDSIVDDGGDGDNIWKTKAVVNATKSREEEFEEYLVDLFM